ncbi:hypothetical protein BDV10DRAFT_201252 [Aspergillus recurvatus]
MTSIRVLDNSTIHDLLINLSRQETLNFLLILEQTLLEFTTREHHYQPTPSVVNRPNGQNTLFRPFTSTSNIGTKISDPAPDASGKGDSQSGVVALCDEKDAPSGVLSAEEVTGYSTSMNAMVPFFWRKHVKNIAIFGAELRASWHSWLILALRGAEVESITYISRDRERANKLLAAISAENDTRSTTHEGKFQQDLESCLREADYIFCATPAKKSLFPASYLARLSLGSRNSSRLPFVSAVGSWQPDMIELDPVLLRLALAEDSTITEKDEGAILVDDGKFALANSGELVQSQIAAKNIVELGEIIALREGKTGELSGVVTRRSLKEMNHFISERFVVYESVGVSLTDLTVSNAIMDLVSHGFAQPIDTVSQGAVSGL